MIISVMKFLNDYYKKSGKNKFLAQGAILAFISDVANISYVNLWFMPQKITISYIQNLYSVMGVPPSNFNRLYLEELRKVMIDSMSFLFLGFLIYHILVYYKFSRGSKWASKYLNGYALTGAILTGFELPGLFGEHPGWGLAMLGTFLIYVFVFMGIRFFRKQEKKG